MRHHDQTFNTWQGMYGGIGTMTIPDNSYAVPQPKPKAEVKVKV
eukprot:CAMPEP_0116882096 /NCGR_PEP_ID=MMETSP0463-20121206/14261_1 /TAXON_ID=181622 /ORGANISM="Strombidinopsis sp, Strain SopsisLIS2011" /LENGTH=43 /DNA_ID= /DNA_START= /DNA_END= /DNA_ORIENTATION=